MSIVELHNVSKSYGRKQVLRNISLTVQAGEFMVVYGLPVSGKSVLVRLITGLEKPDTGSVMLRGQDMTHFAPGDRNLGYVPQSFALYPHYSVYDNIAYPLTLAGAKKNEIDAEVQRAAKLLKIENFLDRKPDQLSGGQKQRVAIARGLVKRTEVFVLDDPLVGLDFKLRERLIEDLKATQEHLKITFIYTTSEAVEATQLATTIAIMHHGEIVSDPDAVRRTVSDAEVAPLRVALSHLLPELASAPVRERTVCLFTNTPDLHFIIDRHPRMTNVWIGAGGNAEGAKFAPTVGQYIAQRAMGIEGDPAVAKSFRIPEKDYDPPAQPGDSTAAGRRGRPPGL